MGLRFWREKKNIQVGSNKAHKEIALGVLTILFSGCPGLTPGFQPPEVIKEIAKRMDDFIEPSDSYKTFISGSNPSRKGRKYSVATCVETST